MKKILAILMIISSSCNLRLQRPQVMQDGTPIIGPRNMHIIIINGCEYIATSTYNDGRWKISI